ncbi:hypothetical protein V3N99_13735 [Dermatophilaceae bacterium Soc4.6]
MRRLSFLTTMIATAAVLPLTVAAVPARASTPADVTRAAPTFAVIGDLPYSTTDLASLPGWIDDINAADPQFTLHLGDIKSGSTRCDTAYFQAIRQQFDAFTGPLVYTPGDNEWTDCHRTAAGAYNPIERLATIRKIFFDQPGVTLGQHPIAVNSQANRGLPENVSFARDDISFAALHVVGSNNDLLPWDGIGHTATTYLQRQEQKRRMSATIDEMNATFANATARSNRAVVLFMQADMFDPTYTPTPADISAFTPLVRNLVKAAHAFPGETYLLNGDSHAYNSDHPLAAGSVWLDRYQVKGSADTLQRITLDGSSSANLDYLKATVNPEGAEHVLGFERVPYSTPAS